MGGRVARVAGVPGDPRVYWAASAQGGVWKSEDGGASWKSVFVDQPVASTGALAVAPADDNAVWGGSGEANIRGNVIAGRGIFRSTDAGKSWKQVWNQVGQIGSLVVHPTDPDVAFAAVLGHGWIAFDQLHAHMRQRAVDHALLGAGIGRDQRLGKRVRHAQPRQAAAGSLRTRPSCRHPSLPASRPGTA